MAADCVTSREWQINSQGSAKSGDVVQVQELGSVTILQAKAQRLPQHQQYKIADACELAQRLLLLSLTAGLQMPESTQVKDIRRYRKDLVNL